MSDQRATDIPAPILKLQHASPSLRRYIILDTNILNLAVTSQGGKVIERLNVNLEKANLITPNEIAFCMTPFQLIEVLGTPLPDLGVVPKVIEGASPGEVVGQVVDKTMAAYLARPELSQPSLEKRARERRSFLPPETLELFDICVLGPCLQNRLAEQVASALAWDHAMKVTYPKSIASDVEFFLTTLLLTTGSPNISRFRIAKRLWERFYARGRGIVSSAAAGIEAANKAMRLKTTRDFLDCDLLHLACFGWFDHDVVVLTCDPPDAILNRIAVYKGMVSAAAALTVDLDEAELPAIRAGVVIRCEPTGDFSHIFPVQRIPTIV